MKKLLFLAAALIAVSALAFAGGDAQGSSGGTAPGSGGKFQGNIVFYAQGYTPVDPTAARPNPPVALKSIAAKYQQLNPGVTIEFMPEVGADQDYYVWLRTKMAGGQAPDIYFGHYYHATSGQYAPGSFVPLTPYYNMPNKYVSGNSKWIDIFPDSLLQTIRDPKGDYNNVVGDYVATQVIYNVQMFKDAGINFEVKNWSDFTRACQMLSAKGYTPWQYNFGANGVDYATWLSRLMGTNLYYPNLKDLAVISGPEALTLSALEVAIGVKNGYFSSKDPRFVCWWPNLLEHSRNYMPQDTVSAVTTDTTIFNKFVNKEIAMFWDGSWAPNNLKAANVQFEYASFPFPYPDKASMPLASDFASSGAVGGYSGAGSYYVASQRASSTMTQAKIDQAVDWLMYITTPENNELMVNDLGSFIPVVKGTKPTEANAGVAAVLANQPIVLDSGPLNLGNDAYQGYYRELQAYLQGNQTLEQAVANIDRLFTAGADDVISKSGQDVSKYLKK
jgi:raffinose/stachyose/melibiose transport system substrate-binding protein